MKKTYGCQVLAVLFYHDGVSDENVPPDIGELLRKLELRNAAVDEAEHDSRGLHLRLKVDGLSEKCRIDYADPEDIKGILGIFGKGIKEERIPEIRYRDLLEDDYEHAPEHMLGSSVYAYFSKTLGLVAISDTDLGRKAD
ncbi:MAG: hypothetical protein AABW53_00775 [Nanoarchaeota archaeon]